MPVHVTKTCTSIPDPWEDMNQRYETCYLWLATARILTWKTAVTCWQLSGSCACIHRTEWSSWTTAAAIHLIVDQPLLVPDERWTTTTARTTQRTRELLLTGYRVSGSWYSLPRHPLYAKHPTLGGTQSVRKLEVPVLTTSPWCVVRHKYLFSSSSPRGWFMAFWCLSGGEGPRAISVSFSFFFQTTVWLALYKIIAFVKHVDDMLTM